MSEFQAQYDSVQCICPYCKASYQVEAEDYSDDERAEECGECGRTYLVSQTFSVDHNTHPDCALNGEEHRWEDRDLPKGKTHPFCAVCDKCQPMRSAPQGQAEEPR